jgi:beta-glucosidase
MTTDVEALVDALTLDEKAALTTGADSWSTAGVPRLGIPKVWVTDGPNGARGRTMGAVGPTSACVPCGSALGATWNPDLIERVGAMLGDEARTKGARVLLAPTVNIHRSPLAGRNFECYSEDPLLAGRLAAAFVRGVQSRGVATTVKHFVGNETEYERMTSNSVIDERALREIYLLPFEIAVREGGALGIMTSYNRTNGAWCTEQPRLLQDIARREWRFDGMFVSDWYAVVGTVASAEAGLDLEMPGPPRGFGPAIADAVRSGALDESVVDAQVRRLLSVFSRVGALDGGGDGTVGDAAGDGGAEAPEESVDRPEHRALAREAATESIVLLRNDGALPLDAARLRTLAVIGPNADRARIMGGGSAALRPHYVTTVVGSLRDTFGASVQIVAERGVDNDRSTPALAIPLETEVFADPDFGGAAALRSTSVEAVFFNLGSPLDGVPPDGWSLRAHGTFNPTESGEHTFTLVQTGPSRVLVDGRVVLDGVADPPPPGREFFGLGSQEIAAAVELVAGSAVDVIIEHSSRGSKGMSGVKVGCRLPGGADLLERAVAAATGADAAVVVVGTTGEWETEGRDRRSMDLPAEQDDLVRRVAAVNPHTVVVVNTGAPVTMDWADDVAAVLQVWFGGQEMGNAVADVLTGAAEPSGRLPTTFPVRVEDNPSYGNFPGENGEVRYGEGVLVGYRWYDARHLPARFPFGHGGSYTTFAVGTPVLSSPTFARGDALTVDVEVVNTGTRRGAEVVQCYVAPPVGRHVRPPKELKAFAKVWLDPGERTTVALRLDDRAFAYWDPGQADWAEVSGRLSPAASGGRRPASRRPPGWYVEGGRYELHVGRSSTVIDHVVPVDVAGESA